MSTFVSIGNAHQPFPRLLREVCRIAPDLPQPVLVQYGHTPFDCAQCQAKAFLDMDQFARQAVAAELLILHAGAGSVIHAIGAGKVPVVMPRRVGLGEHVNDHQLEFARALSQAGKIVLVEAVEHLGAAAAEALQRQRASTTPALVRPASKMVKLVDDALRSYADNK